MPAINPLLQLGIDELPTIIGYLKIAFMKRNPTATPPSDADVVIAYNLAYSSSISKDEAWLAAHPA